MSLTIKSETKLTSIEEVTNTEHGSPYDRGSADSWYGRRPHPHWFPKGTYECPIIREDKMSEQEIAEYHFGYMNSEFSGKNWG